MNVFDIKLVTLGAITFSAITVAIITLLDLLNDKGKQKRLKIILFLYFCSHIITDFCYLIYFYTPSLFIWINWLFLLSMLLIPIFFYRLIFNITTTSASDIFSKYHYLAPIFLSLIMICLTIFTPLEEQILTITGNGLYKGDSILFYIFSNKLFFRLAFNIIYIILSFRCLPRYRKYIINYTANESKSSLKWVTILLFFMIGLMIVPLYGLFITRMALALSVVTFVQTGFLIVQFAYLTFHITKQHYILQESYVLQPEQTNTLKKNRLNKFFFDNFMREYKPYSNKNLKITELAKYIGINRTYLSSFINSEYDMNFSAYINQLRYDEFQRIRGIAKYKNKTDAELTEVVGFGSYRSYTRFISQQNKSTLK